MLLFCFSFLQEQQWRPTEESKGLCQKAPECLHALSEGAEKTVAIRDAAEWERGREHPSGKEGKRFLSLSWSIFQKESSDFSLNFSCLMVWPWWRCLLICSLYWRVHAGSCACVCVFLLGPQWRSLPAEERAHYFKEAEQLRQLHRMKHPGWSCKDNYVRLQHARASLRLFCAADSHVHVVFWRSG